MPEERDISGAYEEVRQLVRQRVNNSGRRVTDDDNGQTAYRRKLTGWSWSLLRAQNCAPSGIMSHNGTGLNRNRRHYGIRLPAYAHPQRAVALYPFPARRIALFADPPRSQFDGACPGQSRTCCFTISPCRWPTCEVTAE